MAKERLTVKNPDGTYRIWMDHAGTFRLGRYEDLEEKTKKRPTC